jgi:hypothetical protein
MKPKMWLSPEPTSFASNGLELGYVSFFLCCTALLDPLLLGCGYTENGTVSGLPMQSQKIKHIVVIMQENRSFDNLFHGFPGADTVDSGQSNGKPVALQPVRIEQGTDVDHSMQVGGKTGTTERWTGLPTQNIPFLTCPMRMFQSNSGPSFPAHQYMIAGQSADADENPGLGVWGCERGSRCRVARSQPSSSHLSATVPNTVIRSVLAG